jgi:stress-induced morphogen
MKNLFTNKLNNNFFYKFSYRNFSRKNRIQEILQEKYSPLKLEIINDSEKHSVAPGSETHFRIFVVSEKFIGKTKVQTHQEIYKLFLNEMGDKHKNMLHSLSIVTKTPDQDSPNDGLGSVIPPKCASKI